MSMLHPSDIARNNRAANAFSALNTEAYQKVENMLRAPADGLSVLQAMQLGKAIVKAQTALMSVGKILADIDEQS